MKTAFVTLLLCLTFIFSLPAQSIDKYDFQEQPNNVLRYDCTFSNSEKNQYFITYRKKSDKQNISYTDTTALGTHHKITIMCLYEKTSYIFEVRDVKGNIVKKGKFKTKALPEYVNFEDSVVNYNSTFKGYFLYDLTRNDPGNPRFTRCLKAIDKNGETVWYQDFRNVRIATCTFSEKQELVIVNNIFINKENEILDYNNVLLDTIIKHVKEGKARMASQLFQMNFKGDTLSVSKPIPYFVNHDCIKLNNGNFLMIVWESFLEDGKQYTASNLVETDALGNEKHKWTIYEHVSIDDLKDCNTASWGVIEAVFGKGILDCYHINSIVEDSEGSIIASFKNCNLLGKIEWKNKTGKMLWMINSPIDIQLESTYLLDTALYFYDQHGILYDEKNKDLWFFDNGNKEYRKTSRGLVLHINEATRKIEKKHEYDLPPKLFSSGKGSFIPAGEGRMIICSGNVGYFALLDRNFKKEVEFKSDIQNYRVTPIFNFYAKHYDFYF